MCIKLIALYLYSDNNNEVIILIFFIMNKVIKIQGSFVNGYTKRDNKSAFVMINHLGQYGYLPNANSPYMPVGRKQTLLNVESILIFK